MPELTRKASFQTRKQTIPSDAIYCSLHCPGASTTSQHTSKITKSQYRTSGEKAALQARLGLTVSRSWEQGTLEHFQMDSLEYDGSVVQLPKTKHTVIVYLPTIHGSPCQKQSLIVWATRHGCDASVNQVIISSLKTPFALLFASFGSPEKLCCNSKISVNFSKALCSFQIRGL